MFGAIFSFELKQGFKKANTYIFFFVYLLFYMVIGFTLSGLFNTTQNDSQTTLNSAISVANILVGLNSNVLGLLNSIILVSIMATSIQKDYQYNMHALFFTKPINKFQYFFGRFSASFLVGLFVMSGMIIGYALGLIPAIGTSLVGPFQLDNLLQPFLIFILPNTFIIGVIFFSLTTFTRSTLTAYMACVVLLIGRFIAESLTGNVEYAYTAALIEPFGSNAFLYDTQYLMAAERNTQFIPFSGALLYNRIIWVSVALIVMLISYYKFSFTQFLSPLNLFKTKKNVQEVELYEEKPLATILGKVQNYTNGFSWRQLMYLSKFEFKKITKSTFFIISCVLTAVLIFVNFYYAGHTYGTESLPLTELVANQVVMYTLMGNIFIIFYTGTVMFREKENKVDELIYSTPVNNTTLLFSKYLGLLGGILIMQIFSILIGIGYQISQGFYGINFWIYFVQVIVFGILNYIVVIGICLAMQIFAPNKYLGFFFSLIPIMILSIAFSMLEWTNNLYHFNSEGPQLPYSALNGFGPLIPYFSFRVYWISFVLIVLFISLFFFARGKEKGLKARFNFSKIEVNKWSKIALMIFAIIFIGVGTFIFYNTSILNKFISPKERVAQLVSFENKYKKYENVLQPRIIDVNLKVDIFPETGSLHVKGSYWLKNKNAQALDSIYVNIFDENSGFKYNTLAVNVAHDVIVDDEKLGVKVFKLNTPLQAGDSILFNFEFDYKPKGFSNNEISNLVVQNGTFFNYAIMPSFGYDNSMELSSNKERQKHGLAKKELLSSPYDSAALNNNFISNDADWIRFEAQVSTSADQTAIAPGYLVKEWKENGRNYFHYKMDNPILNFYAFQSARYKIKRIKWNDINLEVYYDKAHEYNVDNMLLSMKQSLQYYSSNFSPYQFKQLRIVEFPAFASFAQSFANTIPYSENIGFTNKVDTSDWQKIDMPFYVTAHEVAHQWWGHQVAPANVQGNSFVSESMSQYSALMIMEARYGKDNMKKFLKHEMDGYLKTRTVDGKGEKPLMYVQNQSYIYYQKGSVIMYALKDYLGADVLNAALKQYLAKTAFSATPYSTSVELVNYIRAATPDSLKYLIADFFETITVNENYVKSLKSEKQSDGKYKVTLTVGATKFRVDSIGNNTKVPVNDYIDIGVFAEPIKGSKSTFNPLVMQKMKIDANEKTFVFIVNQKPIFAGIDPYNKLIDRTPDNNIANFGSTPKIPSLSEKEVKFDFGSEE